MLSLVRSGTHSYTAQFTGADLKKWYAESGWMRVYICHVLEKVMEDAIDQCLTANSTDVIDALRAAVPNRFKKKVGDGSSVVVDDLLQKYISCDWFSGYHTRMNLLKCVPDDYVFTVKFD